MSRLLGGAETRNRLVPHPQQFTENELKSLFYFNYGIKINLIRIFNVRVLFVNPGTSFPLCYPMVVG